MKIRAIKLLVFLIIPVISGVTYGQDEPGDHIRHSDIFVSQLKSFKSIDLYHVSGVAWGFLPHPLDQRNMERWRKKVERIQSRGIKFQARVEFDARWENMIDYDPDGFRSSIMRTLNGEYLVAPWFADRNYKGIPAYWFCSNAPKFSEYLKFQADHALSASPDVIMMDAQTSTALPLRWYAGCFCNHCLEGFNQFLKNSFTGIELQQMGVDDPGRFNYAEFLKERGYDDQSFRNASRMTGNEIPLFKVYQEYHIRAVNQLSRELSVYIDEQAGCHIPLSTSSPAHQPYRSVIIPEISHYTLEMGQDAAKFEVPFRTILKYRIAEAVDKKILVTALPKQDWKLIMEEDRPGLVRTWIAQAYGYGANFMVPVNQWASGNKRFKGDSEDFTDMYDFIDQHAVLLDGYREFGQIGVLITSRALRDQDGHIDSMILKLTDENIPFKLILVPNAWWEFELDHNILKSMDALLIPFEADELNDTLRRSINNSNTPLISTSRSNNWWEGLSHPIQISESGKDITVLPRNNSDHPEIPVVFHLLNRNYKKERDRVKSLVNIQLQLSGSLFDRRITGATYYRPGIDPVPIELHIRNDEYLLIIPSLDEWGIIAFRSKSIH